MKPVDFEFHAPASVADAVRLLAAAPNARPLAGGQSLVPMLNFRIATPDTLVDLNRIAALRGIAVHGATLSIGAMTTQRALEKSADVRAHCPLLAQAIFHVGHQQTRNRGTIGGSLCHMDPAAELPVVAACLDPVLTIAGPDGERILPFADFPAGYLTTALAHGEILTRIDVPVIPAGGCSAFVEVARRPADFAIVSVAVQLVLRDDGRVATARIAIGGIGAWPMRVPEAEAALAGALPDAAHIAAAAAIAGALPADGDTLNPSEYRQHLAGVLTGRAIAQALKEASHG